MEKLALTGVKTYGFAEGKAYPGEVSITGEKGVLHNCAVASLGGVTLVRCGLIDSEERLKELLSVVPEGRLSILQACRPEIEWERVYGQHQQIIRYLPRGEVVHLNAPMGGIFVAEDIEAPILRVVKAIDHLSKLHNVEGWATYADWIHEETEGAESCFEPTASEEFPLEGQLNDIHREVASPLLKSYREKIASLVLRMAQTDTADRQAMRLLISLEKELILYRGEVQRVLQTVCLRLRVAEAGIIAIEKLHPELIPLKEKIELLRRLMEPQVEVIEEPQSWIQQSILLQLLNAKLGVTSIVNGTDGVGRAGILFALRLAVMQLLEKNPYSDVKSLGIEWPKGKLSDSFRHQIAENLRAYCAPIARLNRKGDQIPKGKLNPELLSLIPEGEESLLRRCAAP